MDELIKALRHFITRDVVYIFGGSTVFVFFVYLFNLLDLNQLGLILSNSEKYSGWVMAPLVAMGLGSMWVIGYMLQELFSLTPIVVTKPLNKVSRRDKWLYHKFHHCEWLDIGEFDFEDARLEVNELASEDNKAELQRIVMLKHVGTTLGACILTCSVLIVAYPLISPAKVNTELLVFSIAISLAFLIVGRIKVLEEMQFIYRFNSRIKNDKTPNASSQGLQQGGK